MSRLTCSLKGFCWPKLAAFAMFLLLWFLQPVKAETRFSFGDAIPSMHGGYYLDGIPGVVFSDTGEPRFTKAVRVAGETLGGPLSWGKELGDVALFPFQEPLIFAGAAAGVGLLMANDYAITAFYQDNIEPAFEWFRPKGLIPNDQTFFPALNSLSIEDEYMLLGMGLTYAYGVAFNNERAQVAALLSAKAVTYSYLTTQVILKPVFGRLRPVSNLSTFSDDLAASEAKGFSTNPFRFGKSPGIQLGPEAVGTAFPSYHYTQYFAVARVYSGVYDNSWIPYALAGVAAVSNIRGHRHWVSDMAAGAVVGTVIGQSVLNNYSERKGLNMSVMPVVSTKGAGVTLSMSF